MNTTTMFTTCLTFEQLQSYSLNKSKKEERAQLYKHISTCELCTCAVNGFTAISFTSADVDAIHHQIDVKTNAMHANPLTFAHVFITGISLLSVFGFYQFANSFSEKKNAATILAHENVKSVSKPLVGKIVPVVEPEVVLETKAERTELVAENKVVEKVNLLVEPLKSIVPSLPNVSIKPTDLIVEPVFNADVIYIYDLKVTNYNSFYFSHQPKPFEMIEGTPAFKENKTTENYLSDKDNEQIIAADKILKSGLASFTKEKYNRALGEFELLLELNPNDVNALFYSAVSYYQIGKYDRTIKNLEAVLKNPNNVFHPEAKWNLALSNLKIGEKAKAKQLLIEIVNAKGFYSKRAADKLKGL